MSSKSPRPFSFGKIRDGNVVSSREFVSVKKNSEDISSDFSEYVLNRTPIYISTNSEQNLYGSDNWMEEMYAENEVK